MHQGEILKQIMQDIQYTQRELANQLGVNESYISQQLKREHFTDAFIEKTCTILEISPERLLPEGTIDYKTKYEAIKERYLNEKDDFLNQVQSLLRKNQALQEEIILLKAK